MNPDARTRLAVLVVLAAVGVTLAGAGVALGSADPLASNDRMGEVSIAGTNVTVAGSDGDVVLTETVPKTHDLEVSEDSGEISVVEQIETADPFTRSERERAIEIARNDETIESYLETIPDPALTVQPVEILNTTEMQTVSFNASDRDDLDVSGEDAQVLEFTNATVEESADSVTIDREPSYLEGVAVVHVGRSDRERARYWVRVDLENGTVTDVTDWDAVGSDQSS
ncbi:hypothetical protein [Halorhabdus rudnickae]|uniref:hypothetical protein n=1 Tax=Halorhabdus rudnickae TaxID=1775544 RepID=UPI0010828F1A|nr:hypothetical protein [Halorhabdus rudnickae]